MRSTTTRKLELFTISGRTQSGVIAYGGFFRELAQVRTTQRTLELGDQLFAITHARIDRRRVFLRVVEGPLGVKPLIFSARRADERIDDLAEDEIVATRTHATVDLRTRRVVVEYNQRGAKAGDLQVVLTEVGRRLDGFESLELSLTPVAQASFVAALDEFRRLRVASVKLARPNLNWNDSVDALSEMAGDSNAHGIEVTVTAARGGSLIRTHGVLEIIRRLLRQDHSPIAAATVTGVREGDEAETSVSLRKYIEHARVRVHLTDAGHVDDDDIEARMTELLDGH